ncbi:Neuropeptide-Like Protein [Caenorhabditis elegans]|uniref:Neuropeptide-Like Protein n=1 Tax=Caenorhabditis elegans TaxID=6239 RepID=Q93827_CAEEL|nr:Neuropeptide-Like Protein [Caenorhabditis elegans]CAB01975.2 Neuropeptide-Like Protein [Caenorhabditis elegans]|eukprot:NP_492151.2 Uncharacterized protein CELE_F58H10.1 [Caenorhabditis elegans]
MQLKFLVFILLSVLLTSTIARPQYKDIDYKLYGDGDDGVAVDAVYEVISDKPPEGTPTKHHHHHHHKKMSKSNRLDRLRRYLNDRLRSFVSSRFTRISPIPTTFLSFFKNHPSPFKSFH